MHRAKTVATQELQKSGPRENLVETKLNPSPEQEGVHQRKVKYSDKGFCPEVD